MSKFGKRVKAKRVELGYSQSELAEIVGAGQATIGHIESGRNQTYRDIVSLAKALKTTPEYLLTGQNDIQNNDEDFPKPPNEKDYVLIPQYTAKGECGQGDLNEHVEIKGELAFKKEWLQKSGLSQKNLEALYAKGDSMFPTITDGAAVLVDHSKTSPIENKVFLIHRSGNGLIIKRLVRDREGGWVYQSDNTNKSQFPDMYPLDEDDIRGRVVWQGGMGGL